MIDKSFWQKKKVFITGHTGFKGSWLCLMLHRLKAKVTGYALPPPTDPNLFSLCKINDLIHSVIADIRDLDSLKKAFISTQPDIVFHMAAQPLVRESYKNPLETFSINVMGTVNLFEAIRNAKGLKAVINVTTDKCYENREWLWGYRENEPLGGYDPYASSKACSELITAAYRSSFFNPKDYASHGVGIASVRAGNVIGGGDWSTDRLFPDCVRALLSGKKILIRNPQAVRPWQHVLEPLSAYLLLAQKIYEEGPTYSEAWNFGPDDSDSRSVEWIVKKICKKWGNRSSYTIDRALHPHEAHYLKLDCSKAKAYLGWYPKWNLEHAIDKVIEWTKAYAENQDVRAMCDSQIREYWDFAHSKPQ